MGRFRSGLPKPPLGNGGRRQVRLVGIELEQARAYLSTLPPATVLVVDRGRVVVQWGDPAKRVKVSSVRKSFLSVLYGIYVQEDRINLNKTLAELSIDDSPPLTDIEKKATVKMLLQSRSGIYHGYVAGTPGMYAATQARGSHRPGSFWYYNNWDFNALGTIFEKQTGTGIGAALLDRIAQPIGMEDYRVEDVYYQASARCPRFFAVDASCLSDATHRTRYGMLRIPILAAGQLERQAGGPPRVGGRKHQSPFEGRQKRGIPKRGKMSRGPEENEDAYCWWVNGFGLPVKSFSARGAMAKYIVVIP